MLLNCFVFSRFSYGIKLYAIFAYYDTTRCRFKNRNWKKKFYFQNNYIYEESLCVNNNLPSDPDSVDQFLYLIRHWISDTLSSIVIEKSSGKAIGTIVCRFCSVEDKSLEFSRLRVIIFPIPHSKKPSDSFNIYALFVIFKYCITDHVKRINEGYWQI